MTAKLLLKQALPKQVEKIQSKRWYCFCALGTQNPSMRSKPLVYHFLNTNCITVSKEADIDTLASVFAMSPAQFVPVLDGLEFKGVVFRTEFETGHADKNISKSLQPFISKEVPILAPENSIGEAIEVFKGSKFDIIAVVDEEKNLMGLLHREEVENQSVALWPRWLGVMNN